MQVYPLFYYFRIYLHCKNRFSNLCELCRPLFQGLCCSKWKVFSTAFHCGYQGFLCTVLTTLLVFQTVVPDILPISAKSTVCNPFYSSHATIIWVQSTISVSPGFIEWNAVESSFRNGQIKVSVDSNWYPIHFLQNSTFFSVFFSVWNAHKDKIKPAENKFPKRSSHCFWWFIEKKDKFPEKTSSQNYSAWSLHPVYKHPGGDSCFLFISTYFRFSNNSLVLPTKKA